jgi:hypothetical protein
MNFTRQLHDSSERFWRDDTNRRLQDDISEVSVTYSATAYPIGMQEEQL